MKLRKKNYDLLLILVTILIVAIAFIFFNNSREFGINLFSEIAGVAITVLVIDKIMERRERQKRIAIDQRILREIQSIIASYFSIWKHLAWRYLPNEKIQNEIDLLRHYPRIAELTLLNDRFEFVSIHHPESWKLFFHNRPIRECFKNYYETLTGEIQAFINDFKIYIEPELLDCLLNIMECKCIKDIYLMNQEGTEKIIIELEEDPNRLSAYLGSDPGHLSQFMELMGYSERLRKMIDKFTDSSIELYEVGKYFIHPTKFV